MFFILTIALMIVLVWMFVLVRMFVLGLFTVLVGVVKAFEWLIGKL